MLLGRHLSAWSPPVGAVSLSPTTPGWTPPARVLSSHGPGAEQLLLVTAVSVVFGIVGLVALDAKSGVFREWFQVRSTPTTTVQAAPVGEAHVEGRLRPAGGDGPVESPGGRSCGYVYWREQERSVGVDGWETVSDGERPARMAITDDTGSMLVDTPVEPDVRDAEPSALVRRLRHASRLSGYRTEFSITCPDDDSGYRARMKLREAHVVTSAHDESPDRRYREFVIPHDQTVYVTGQATRDELAEETETTSDLVLVAGERGDGLLLADRPEGELTWLLAKEWGVYFLFGFVGVLIGGLGLLGLLTQAGPLAFAAALAVALGLLGLLVRAGALG